MSEEATEKKAAVRKARAKALIVVGKWSQDGDRAVFNQLQIQPPATTELAVAVAWAKSELPPGRYEFIRQLPQTLTMSEQKLIKSVLA